MNTPPAPSRKPKTSVRPCSSKPPKVPPSGEVRPSFVPADPNNDIPFIDEEEDTNSLRNLDEAELMDEVISLVVQASALLAAYGQRLIEINAPIHEPHNVQHHVQNEQRERQANRRRTCCSCSIM